MTENNNNQNVDVNYWKSFEELYNNSSLIENKEHEFLPGVTDEFDVNKNLSGLSRRKFLALLGASAAVAGAGCSDYRDKGEIVPYNQQPEGVVLGKPNYYASTCNFCSLNCGILIKTREGRPIKVDGNPDHPISKGKICSKAQAGILNLYDPSRIQSPRVKINNSFESITWNKLQNELQFHLSNAGTNEIALITHNITSPTQKKLFDEFVKKYPSTKVYSYDLFNNSTRNSAWKKCYGSDVFPAIKFDKAKVIVSFEGDFLGVDGSVIENIALFAKTRNVDDLKSFSRLYSIEANLSLTGLNSDYRIPLRADAQYEFVMVILNEVSNKLNLNINGLDKSLLNQFELTSFAAKYNLDKKVCELLISDLLINRGNSIVYGGRALEEKTHIAINFINHLLNNFQLYDNENLPKSFISSTSNDEWLDLVEKMNKGGVSVVINFDTNPVYHLPANYNFSTALKNVPTVITLTEIDNETTEYSNYVLPINSMFESWGDFQTRDGFYSLQQPVIAPLYKTKQKESILLNLMGVNIESNSEAYYDFLKNNWLENFSLFNSGGNFERFWVTSLHDGVAHLKNKSTLNLVFNNSSLSNLTASVAIQGLNLLLTESMKIGDGRFSNNGWLQEIPHPISKITWDNYAAISESTAKSLGVSTNDLVVVKNGNNEVTIPILIQPGIAENSVAIELGYGRTNVPIVASEVGFNANLLLDSKLGLSLWNYTNISIEKTNKTYSLVSTQDHHSFDNKLIQDLHFKRHIIKEGTVEKYSKNPHFLHEGAKHENKSFYKDFEYNGNKWGMAIDLNKCIGCAQCVASCNVENNIPVVGKDQVYLSREMHWIRIDRYYSGTPANPKISVQPMLCQHCDHAPCENVCPVVATQHSPDGLNQMVYNRCVGTRYCSNNCPYKVRRFNFYNFRDHFKDAYYESDSLSLVHNPEVTVRSRGVMEKCTFCIQRIMDGRSEARAKNKPLKGSDIVTACQSACPANAIVFGDTNDKEDLVVKYREHNLAYHLLEELNIKPNVTYLAKLRNIHSEEA